MIGGVQGFNMSMQFGNPQCVKPPPRNCKSFKCKEKYYIKCKKQWIPVGTTNLGSIR